MQKVKKFITGTSTSQKSITSMYMNKIYPESKDHNELDALSILEYTMKFHDKQNLM